MTITNFFKHTLRAHPKNIVWSWGAIDASNRVFLKVWMDQIERHSQGERVLVYIKHPKVQSSGQKERLEHIDAIRRGAQGFAVVCRARKLPEGRRKIAGFDQDRLLRLSGFVEENDRIYAPKPGERAPRDGGRIA